MTKAAKIKFLIFFLYCYSLEDFILKFLPISGNSFLILRTIPEFIIIIAGLTSLVKVTTGKTKSYRRMQTSIILLLIYLIFNLMVKTPTLGGALNLLAFIRFLPVTFFASTIPFTREDIKKIVRALFVIGLIQILFGLVQKSAILNFKLFIPREISQGLMGVTYGTKDISLQSGLLGSVLHAPTFAFLLCILLVIIYTTKNMFVKSNVIKISLTIIIGYLISFSFSTLSTVLFFALLFYYLIIRNIKKKRTLIYLFTIFPVIISILIYYLFLNNNPISEELRSKLSVDFITNGLMYTRLWMLGTIAPSVLFHSPLMGVGPDQEIARHLLFQFTGDSRVLVYNAFEDVYWATILMYYGVIGLLLYLNIFRQANLVIQHLKLKETDPFLNGFYSFQRVFLIMFAFYSFFITVPEIRITSYIFWLNIGILLSIIKYNGSMLICVGKK